MKKAGPLLLLLAEAAEGWPALLRCKRELEVGGMKIHFALPEPDEVWSSPLVKSAL